ncbi:urease accessory protein UreD [Stappia sp. ES.058]|uniref:urease accessory protein UreD n=1 Tax=Stappia sp. ES.058 TaxID=1881061 RepID=UPI00087C9DD9|nr:urease accessory protein UreD [Stappia sp. ES.058]SDU40877.1 urease accessory protein [Stappia sp. ES.058]
MTIDTAFSASANPLGLQRVTGRARVRFEKAGGTVRLRDLDQSGSAKVRIPKTHGDAPLAVFLNTAGGLTGGDSLEYEAGVGEDAQAVITTQAAERIYRSQDGPAQVQGLIRVDSGGLVEWLPQETILFDKAALTRALAVDLEGDARLLAVESVVLGREAMGEDVHAVSFRDRWRIRRNGQLVFADETRISGDATDILSGSATAAGGRAFATLVDCRKDAETEIDRARDALAGIRREGLNAGVSARTGLLIFRLVAENGQILRAGLMALLEMWRGARLPRTWYC